MPVTTFALTDDPVTAELERFGVSVVADGVTSSSQRQVILDAVRALAAKTAALTSQDDPGTLDSYQAFGRMFGPTIIRIYQDRANVDGVHAALNCGWEGKFAAGCQAAEVYPEQVFPENAWLILAAGGYTSLTASDGGVGLYAHELVHNMTWGGGQNPSNIGGSSYVRYVGDVFAIRYMDYLGVQVGREAYVDEDARRANPLWRAELTADAVSSWALDLVSGPYAPIIVHYIQGMMACELSGRKRC